MKKSGWRIIITLENEILKGKLHQSFLTARIKKVESVIFNDKSKDQ
jgi:hypothetical protein